MMKKFLGILFLSLLINTNVSAGWFSKLPVLACKIGNEHLTFDLREYEPYETAIKKNKFPDKILTEVTDNEYTFTESVDQGDGTHRQIRYYVNRYSGIIDIYVSPKYIRFKKGALKSSLKTEIRYNGICKGVK